MADAQVEYKRVDLWSYEARNGASLAQSFTIRSKYNFSFPPVEIDAINPALWAKENLKREPQLNIWQCTGSKYGAEIRSKLTCVLLAATWSHRRLNWTTMLHVQSNIDVYGRSLRL